MSVFWLQPSAWWGLAAVALPILVHLLARHRVREMPFPSLRFLRPTALAALRRRLLSDIPLLLVRVAVIATAVAALAAPAIVSSGRRQAWERRVSRVVIDARSTADAPVVAETAALIESERSSAFTSTVFVAHGALTDALIEASHWLATEPPSSREIVIVGDLRAGAVVSSDLVRVPPWIGLRVLPTPVGTTAATVPLSSVVDAGNGTAMRTVVATVTDDATRIVFEAERGAVPALVTVRAPATDQRAAVAARDAVFAEGVRLPRGGERPVEVEFAGAPGSAFATPPAGWMRETLAQLPSFTGGERDGRLVVRTAVRADDPAAPHVIARVLRAAWSDPLTDLETRRIPAAALAAWGRAPSGLPPDVGVGNDGDARWLWVMVLALLAIEWWLRRSPRSEADSVTTAVETEARVA